MRINNLVELKKIKAIKIAKNTKQSFEIEYNFETQKYQLLQQLKL